jgi:hypothetical protein
MLRCVTFDIENMKKCGVDKTLLFIHHLKKAHCKIRKTYCSCLAAASFPEPKPLTELFALILLKRTV